MLVPPVMCVPTSTGTGSAGKRASGAGGRQQGVVLPSAIATSASLRLLITCSGVCLLLAILPRFHGPILTYYLDRFLGAGHLITGLQASPVLHLGRQVGGIPYFGVGTVWRGNMLALAGIVDRTWRDVGQAQGLASAGGSVDWGGTGQAQGLPLQER